MTIATAIEDYLVALRSERNLARNTVVAYRRDLTQYREFLGLEGVSEVGAVTSEVVERFARSLSDRGLAASTAARKLAAVRGLHGFLVMEGVGERDPTAQLDAPQRPSSLPKALSIDEIHALLEAPNPSTPLGVRDRALFELMYATGARVAETVGLRVEDVDLEGRSARVTGKGNKQRIVPLGRFAVDAIAAYLAVRLELKGGRSDSGWLFLNARGGRLTRQGVFGIIRGHAARAGLDPTHVSPHVLRHSAATHMVEGGADLRTVQEILGHANITTTQIYTRVSPQHLYEVFVTSHPRSG
jgi:integrase/recombinase XerD